MSTQKILTLFLAATFAFTTFVGCETGSNNTDVQSNQEQVSIDLQATKDLLKYEEGDPIKETIVESEFFEISGLKEHVIEGKNGTIISIPKGCFVDSNGNTITKDIQIELAEANTIDELLASGLTTKTEKELLNMDGALYINATSDGKQLYVNPETPLYIDKPVNEKNPDQKVFKGVRGDDGQIYWVDPQEQVSFLTPIPIDELDFLPGGFADAVQAAMPYRSYTSATSELVDSFYYHINHEAVFEYAMDRRIDAMTDDLLDVMDSIGSNSNADNDPIEESHGDGSGHGDDHGGDAAADNDFGCGIHPHSIKALRNKKFENTYIATREFEARLQVLFTTCKSDLLDIYLENIEGSLWQADAAVAQKITESDPNYEKFRAFAAEQLTNVEVVSPRARGLAKYYQEQRTKIQRRIEVVQDKAKLKEDKADAEAAELKQEYNTLLKKREKYRMDKFGFERTTLGWTAVGTTIIVQELPKFELNIQVADAAQYDRVHVYNVNPNIQSLFAMVADDGINFNRGLDMDPHLIYRIPSASVAVVVAYKDDKVFYDDTYFTMQWENNKSLSPKEISPKQLKNKLKKYRSYGRENKISVDLKFQEAFQRERERQERLLVERELQNKLYNIAFPCCNIEWPAPIAEH